MKQFFVSQIWVGAPGFRMLADCKRWTGEDPHCLSVEIKINGKKQPAELPILVITRRGQDFPLNGQTTLNL